MFKKRRLLSLEADVLRMNKVAMDFLKQARFAESLALLKKAESALVNSSVEERNRLSAITLNNFGCYYKKKGQLKVALEYLLSALELELEAKIDSVDLSSTYLNITAIYSALHTHSQALHYAHRAIHLLESALTDHPKQNHCTSLLIAYHNAGTELEHLQRYSEALAFFEKGIALGTKHLDVHHPLTTFVSTAAMQVRLKAENSSSRNEARLEHIRKTSVHRIHSRQRMHRYSTPGGLRFRSVSPLLKKIDQIPKSLAKIKAIASKLM